MFASHQAYLQQRSQSQTRFHYPTQSASLSTRHQQQSKLRCLNSSSGSAASILGLGSWDFGLELSWAEFWQSSTQDDRSSSAYCWAWDWNVTGEWEHRYCCCSSRSVAMRVRKVANLKALGFEFRGVERENGGDRERYWRGSAGGDAYGTWWWTTELGCRGWWLVVLMWTFGICREPWRWRMTWDWDFHILKFSFIKFPYESC